MPLLLAATSSKMTFGLVVCAELVSGRHRNSKSAGASFR